MNPTDLAIRYLNEYYPQGRSSACKELGVTEVALNNAIHEVFGKNKLVELVPRNLHRDTEEQLVGKYPKLVKALVVESPPSGDDNDRYVLLGKAMAAFLDTSFLVRPGDMVGLGSGKGVWQTINALKEESAIWQGTTLASLAGKVFYGDQHVMLDCDGHVDRLADRQSMRDESKILVGKSLAHENSGEMEEVRMSTILKPSEWDKRPPNVAIVGVGTVAPGHKLWEFEKSPKAIRKALAELVNVCRKYMTAEYSPVGDTCHHLFYVEPPKGTLVAEESEIQARVQEINQRLLTVHETHFQKIPALAVVAGGIDRHRAIHKLLTDENFKVRVLCVDTAAATGLLAESKASASAAN